MNDILNKIKEELAQVIDALSIIPNNEPFSIAHSNWSFPGLTKNELIYAARDISELIDKRGREDLGPSKVQLEDYIRRLQYLRTSTIPQIWGNAAVGVSTYFFTLAGLSKALEPALKSDIEIDSDIGKLARDVMRRLRAIENRLRDTEPRSENIVEMVNRIEQAYQAADQLPTDLQLLKEEREKIADLVKSAQHDYGELFSNRNLASKVALEMTAKNDEAKAIFEQIQSTYAAATSQGLAAAFTERSRELANSMWVWTTAFVIALVLGASFGTQRVKEINDLLKNPAMTNWALLVNLLLAVFSVGAPIWFGWMATKQINQRFRLSEDYAFKAAVSRAYEGYRKEAARIDKDLEAKLLASALTRLDEQPLRFVESANHGSPWHELATSPAVKTAMSNIPGFADRVVAFAQSALSNAIPKNASTSKDSRIVPMNDEPQS